MRTHKLILLLVLLGPVWSWSLFAQNTALSPHGVLIEQLDCSDCHTDKAWKPLRENATFDHNQQTRFSLLGRHSAVKCESCHAELRFDIPALRADECAGCHNDVHQGQFENACVSCHSTTSFHDVDAIAIHANTNFPLTGSHEQLTCESCHQDDLNGAFAPLDTDCFSCHEAAYVSATSIDHVAAGFPIQCEQCHSALAWTGNVNFDHLSASNGFELVGAHDRILCESCHTQPDFALVFATTDQNDCVGCHEADYNREHQGTGFPTTCLDCHNADSWGDATFAEHDPMFFPIFSGTHGGEWDGCQTCHTDSANFKIFTCFNCHEHNESSMNGKHDEVSGYAYDSILCYQCHPTGRAEDD